jgi:hypothetical protein
MRTINLQPDPRILPMLGEINLSQERCLAELVDNSIDGFLMESEQEDSDCDPQVSVELPSANDQVELAQVMVRDNGPGMDITVLEKAVKAGWSGNNPIGNLGLFGMGFNIATARLGRVTQVWTTRSGDKQWQGIEIDFQKLIRDKSFETDLLTKPKIDENTSGTEIVIKKLKQEQAVWLSKPASRNKLRAFFSKIYSTMLRPPGRPIKFKLLLNGRIVKPKLHCVWGEDENRSVQTRKYGPVDAYQVINYLLPSKKFCLSCWTWLALDVDTCHACGEVEKVIVRERRVLGWLGILRYLSKTDFGIDFVRNGRKIEVQDRSLFQWEREGIVEDEYPIDDPRRRGRIVGEIHLDHCRVSYTKDRFDRDDLAWHELKTHLRGEGPLRPDKAAQLGYTQNTSPLFLLFQAFRRSTPSSRVAGAYNNLLVVKNNDVAVEYARKFDEGDSRFSSDTEWYRLVQEADEDLLSTGGGAKPHSTPTDGEVDEELDGVIDLEDDNDTENIPPSTEIDPQILSYRQELLASLSRDYVDDLTAMRFQIEAYSVDETHPKLVQISRPWYLERGPRGNYSFYVNREDVIFGDMFTALDALLAEISHNIALLNRDQVTPPDFSSVLGSLRAKYIEDNSINVDYLAQAANQELDIIAKHLVERFGPEDNMALFNELTANEQRIITSNMATNGVSDSQLVLTTGMFLEFSSPYTVLNFVERHPEIFFDDILWEMKFSSISFEDIDAKKIAQDSVLRNFTSFINDVIWLSNQSSTEMDEGDKNLVLRASVSLEMLQSYRHE